MTALTTGWEQSVSRFIEYLPKSIERWLIWSEPVHQRIVSSLTSQLPVTESFTLGQSHPDQVMQAAKRYHNAPEVGLIGFTIKDIRASHRHYGYTDALNHFASWMPVRARLCLDVWDENFAMLFSESPQELAQRCRDIHDCVASQPTLSYHSEKGLHSVTFECEGSQWTCYDGLGQTARYLLPMGEVACSPKATDGVLDVDGWLIGTIPFGVKYGRIHPGELILGFEAGQITTIAGRNTALCADIGQALENIPSLRSVGELGIGQSHAAAEAARQHWIGWRWHERAYGLHIGLGVESPHSINPDESIASHHLDIVLAKGTLQATSAPILTW